MLSEKETLRLKLEEIASGLSLEGVEPSSVVTVVAAIAIPPASLQLVYRLPDGGLRERLLTRPDKPSQEVVSRRIQHLDKTLAAVNKRLRKEIDFWMNWWMKLSDDQEVGEDVRLNVENARRAVTDLDGRFEHRTRELKAMRHVLDDDTTEGPYYLKNPFQTEPGWGVVSEF